MRGHSSTALKEKTMFWDGFLTSFSRRGSAARQCVIKQHGSSWWWLQWLWRGRAVQLLCKDLMSMSVISWHCQTTLELGSGVALLIKAPTLIGNGTGNTPHTSGCLLLNPANLLKYKTNTNEYICTLVNNLKSTLCIVYTLVYNLPV